MSKNLKSIREKLQVWDQDIKAGKIQKVREELLNWPSFKSLSEINTASFAQVCRRVELSDLGTKILHPHIQKKRQLRAQYQDHFALFKEYAANLITLGICHEGRMILSQLIATPETMLLQAFSYIHEWKYSEASLQLKELCLQLTPKDYQFWVAQMNLISCYNFLGEYQQAITLAEESINSGQMNPLMSSYAYQQQGISYLEMQDYKRSKECFKMALSTLDDKPHDQLVKWNGILTAVQEKDISYLRRLRTQANKSEDFETLRSLDYYKAVIKQSSKIFQQLYFGTPHTPFKEKISASFSREEYEFNKKSKGSQKCLDLLEGTIEGKSFLSKYKNNHKLLQILLSDFYAPISEATIHQQLYPGEVFHPFSTPQRISQQVYQLNNDFKAIGISVSVTKNQNLYKLHLSDDVYVKIKQGQTQDILLHHWYEKSQGRSFTAKDLAEWSGKSSRTALLIANELVAKNILLLAKRGRKHFYKFSENIFLKSAA